MSFEKGQRHCDEINKQQINIVVPEYSSSKSQSNQSSINVEKIHFFMEQKQEELNELQKFLISQFEQMEKFKGTKQKLQQLLSQKIIKMFEMLKKQIAMIISQYSKQFTCMNTKWSQFSDMMIKQKNNQIENLQFQLSAVQLSLRIEKQKNQKQFYFHQRFSRQKKRSISKNKSSHDVQYHIQAEKNFLKAHSEKCLDQEQFGNSRQFSNISDNFSQLKNSKFHEDPKSNKKEKSLKVSPGRAIMKQVKKALKEQFENQKIVGQKEHKKYVKQKIEKIKNRHSILYNETARDTKKSFVRF